MTKRMIRPFKSGVVALRLLTKEDLPMTLAWRNKDRVRRNFVTSRPITPDEHHAWFKNYVSRDDDFVFLISDAREPSRLVGQVSLYHIDWALRRAEFGRLLIGEESALGRGLAHAASDAMLHLALDVFKLRAVTLEVFEANSRAIHIYRKLGFVEVSARDGLLCMGITERSRSQSGK